MIQTVKGHLVIGLDFECALMAGSPPVPSIAPNPFLFIGTVDLVMGEALMPPFSTNFSDSKVQVWGMPGTKAGKKAAGVHIPLGPYVPIFNDIRLKAEGKTNFLFGSNTVKIEGNNAVRLGEIGMNCTIDPVPLPTTNVISWPGGPLVLTGGPSALDVNATLITVTDELMTMFLGAVFTENSFLYEFLKAYLGEVFSLCRDSAIIAMTESDEQKAEAAIQEKMMALFTKAPFEALRAAAFSLTKIKLPSSEDSE